MNDDQNKSHLPIDSRSYRRSRHALPLAASIAAHAALLAALVFMAPALTKPHGEWVLAYLVEVGDGHPGDGDAHRGVGGVATVSAETGPIAVPKPKPHRDRIRASIQIHRARIHRAKDAPPTRELQPDEIASGTPAAPADAHSVESRSVARDSNSSNRASIAPSRIESGTAQPRGTGPGSGDGTSAGERGGDGFGGTSNAHADYERNPAPGYPALARRRAEQGTVTLRVMVRADGTVARVELAESSGHDVLDDSAVETVRTKWRFEPARRDGVAFESWVLVPIRFTLTEANAAR